MTVGTVCIVSAELNGYHHFRLRVDSTALGHTTTTYPDISCGNISQAVSMGERIAQRHGYHFILTEEDIATMNQNYIFTPAADDVNLLRMALVGPTGSGKSWNALSIATHLGNSVALIDTENKSASKYKRHFDFQKLDLVNHAPRNYVDAITAASQQGFDVLIIDSLSHAWAGRGGALEMVDAASARYRNNQWAAWRDVTPEHNALVDALIYADMHLIVTMRAKTEWVIEKDEKGKSVPVKIGLEPIQRKGLEYEFDVIADLDEAHRFIVSKTRCPELDHLVVIKPTGEGIAKTLQTWLASTRTDEPAPVTTPTFGPVDVNPVDRAGNVPNTADINFDTVPTDDAEDDNDRHPDAGKDEVFNDILTQINDIGEDLYEDSWHERGPIIASKLFDQDIQLLDEYSLDINQAQQLLKRMKNIEKMFAERNTLLHQINALGEEIHGDEWDDQTVAICWQVSQESTTSLYKLSLHQLQAVRQTLLDIKANISPTMVERQAAGRDALTEASEDTLAGNSNGQQTESNTLVEFADKLAQVHEMGVALHAEAWTDVLESLVRKASNQTTTDIHLLSAPQLHTIFSMVSHDYKQQQEQDEAAQYPTNTPDKSATTTPAAALTQERTATLPPETTPPDTSHQAPDTGHQTPDTSHQTPNTNIPTALALDALGEQIYGPEEWPRQRRNAVRKFTEQRTASIKKMDDNERAALHIALLHVQANQ